MASAIGTALISTSLSFMVDKAMDNGKRIVKYTADKAVDVAVDGFVNIQRDISKLQKTLYMIEGIVQVAEEKQINEQGKPVIFIQNWLHDLVDIAYEARDVLDDFITFSSCIIKAEEASNPVNFISSFMLCYFGGSSDDTSNIPLTVLNRLEKDIRGVRERFDEMKEEGDTFATSKDSKSVRVDSKPIAGPSTNKQGDGLFLGREEVKKGIMQKILHPRDDHVHVVVISGMGGIGKTTLARSIYNHESVKKVLKKWLCVGESKFCAEKVIREIVNDQNTTGIGNLDAKLQKELSENRFLIVLDDVWDVDGNEWNSLFNPLTHVGKGGLIIITRRERELCAEITIQTAYNLELLSEQDSWLIFKSHAFIDGNSDSTPDLKCIGKKIVKKLNGLPLALEVVGRSLLNKDSSTWKKFLESKLTKDDEVMSALRWSYNHLPRHLKTCFTYCSLFPKDHVLDKKVLVQMWMAHDLIQKEEQERPEDVGAQYFEQLVNASLLQCVDGKYAMHDLIHGKHMMHDLIHGKHMMHDLIHDLALLVSNGEFAIANSSLTNDQMETVRHVTITRGDYSKVPRLSKMEKLLTLYTTHTLDETDDEIYPTEKYVLDVFNQLKSIRVLVIDCWEITDIPDRISELRHLRYLDVSKTRVKSLPNSLCRLYNLQMLAAPLVDLTLQPMALPIDIVNFCNLRYVRAKLVTCKGVGKLTSLQELSSIHVCEGDNIRELGDMQILRGKLRIEGLENVSILEGDAGALMEKQILMDALELKFDKQLTKLKFNKQLKKSTNPKKVLDTLRCPPNLTYLRIVGYNGLNPPSWMVDRKHKFDKLHTLVLDSCSKLESLPPLGKFANFMTSLSRLNIWNCDGLKRLQLDALVFLKELKITCCSSLVHITSAICESLKISSCRLLEKMDVARCDSLQVVIKILKLEVEYCESFRSLSIHGLDSLEHLTIIGCPTLELAFEDGSSSSSSSGNSVAVPIHGISTDSTQVFRTLLHHELVSLESFKIRNLGGFENFDETEANNFCKLRSLKILAIWQCEDLKSLPPNFHKLSSLVGLSIYNCPQLQSLPADGLPPSLRSVSIIRCPLLYERCKDKSGLDWHKINHIRKREISEYL